MSRDTQDLHSGAYGQRAKLHISAAHEPETFLRRRALSHALEVYEQFVIISSFSGDLNNPK